MGIQTQSIYASKLSSDISKRTQPRNSKIDEKDPFSWRGFVEVDLLTFPTINGTIDIDQKANIYVILGAINLPNNTIEFNNEYEFFVS